MSEALQGALTYTVSTIGLWVTIALAGEAVKLFIYIQSIVKRKDDEKLLKELISSLNSKKEE